MPQPQVQSSPSRLICERCGEEGILQHAGGKTRVYAKAYVLGTDDAECCATHFWETPEMAIAAWERLHAIED